MDRRHQSDLPGQPQAAPLDRRVFLKQAAMTTLVLAAEQSIAAADGGPLPTAEKIVPGKDARLIVHAPQPAVFETPAELLLSERVTPTSLLFVRNNQQPADAASMKPPTLSGWKIELAGLINAPRTVDGQALLEFDQVEHEMVLQCSGNGRALFSRAAPAKGTQWSRGGMANVRFSGVPLAAILRRYGIEIQPQARFLTAAGHDDPPPGEQDFEHSIPLDDALKRSILAVRLNGEFIPAIHGGPVRLVTPGYYGTMHVKWLEQLRFEARESDHTSQIPHYRTPRETIQPGQPFSPTYANSEPNWRMKLKCLVLTPVPAARLSSGEVLVRGVAFNDGDARIDSVLVSVDAGHTWQQAQVEVPESPYAWYRWQARVRLTPGARQIWALAIDALGRSQPQEGSIAWNASGYTWNGVEKIDVAVV